MKSFRKWLSIIKEYYLKILNNSSSFKKVFANGNIEYRSKVGELHREDGPAIEFSNGDKFWYIDGKKHREDGPAIYCPNCYKEWWVNGKRHREDGPAVEYSNGEKHWYLNGERHREDGPAIEWPNEYKEWWFLNGRKYTKEEFLKIQIKNSKTVKLNFQCS